MPINKWIKLTLFLIVIIAFPLNSLSAAPTPQKPITGSFDVITYDSGVIVATGWAASIKGPTPIAKIEIYMEKTLLGKAKLGMKRTDVSQVTKNKKWIKSGWEFRFTKKLKKGSYSFHAVAYGKKNEKVIFNYARKLTVG